VADVSLSDQLACARRELKLRTSLYPRWVAAEQMTDRAAKRELAGMTAIVQTLLSLIEADARQRQPGLWGEETA
jgi:hypothetical protein